MVHTNVFWILAANHGQDTKNWYWHIGKAPWWKSWERFMFWFIFVNSSHEISRLPILKHHSLVWGQLQWLKNSQLWISQLRGSLGQPAFPKTGSQFWSKIWRSQNGFCHAHLYVYIMDIYIYIYIYVYVYIQYYHIHTHTVFRMHMKSYLNQYASWIILSLCVCTVPV